MEKDTNQDSESFLNRKKKVKGRGSQQGITLKSPIKKSKKVQRDRFSVLVSDSIKRTKSIEKKKKESLEDLMKKLNKNKKKSPEKKRQRTVQIKEDSNKKEKKEKSTDEPRKPRKPSYYDKYYKPKETFHSTSKNPKINEILNKLKESGTLKLPDDTNSNVGKIDSNKIQKYNKLLAQEKYRDQHKKVVQPKIKAVIEKIKNSSDQSSAIISSSNLPMKIDPSSNKQYFKTETNLDKESDNKDINKEKEIEKGKKKKKKKRHRRKSYNSEEDSEESEESEEESEEEEKESSSYEEERRRRKKKKKKKEKDKEKQVKQNKFNNLVISNNELTVGGSQKYDGFSLTIERDPDQEKYKNKKSNINYQKFSFNYYEIGEKDFKSKNNKKSKKKVELIPQNEIEITLYNEIEIEKQRKFVKNKGHTITIIKDKKKSNQPNTKNPKIKSLQYESDNSGRETDNDNDEKEHNKNNYRKYEIVGYNNKAKRMSIMDILKKRKISIVSEEPFKTSTFLDKIKNDKKNNKPKRVFNDAYIIPTMLERISERPEIKEYSKGVKYIVFKTSLAIKKRNKKNWHPEEFEESNEVNITLKGFLQLMREERERERERENQKKKEIEPYRKNKVNSNYIVKNKIPVISKSRDKSRDNANKSSSLMKKNLKNKKGITVSFTLDKSVDQGGQSNNKSTRDKILTGDLMNKSNTGNLNSRGYNSSSKNQKPNNRKEDNDNRAIKPPVFSRYSSSEDEEEEEEEDDDEEKEEEKEDVQVIQEQSKIKKPNKFDELLHAYGTNYDYEIKKVKFTENNKSNGNEGKNRKKDDTRLRSNSRNNVMKNRVDSENIYTDKRTNEIRKSFKKKLTNNQYVNNEDDSNNNIYKIKIRNNSKGNLGKNNDDKNIYTDKETNEIRKTFKKKLTHNEYANNDDDIDPNNVNKVKGNKAKIRKFRSKNENENELPTMSKKNTAYQKQQGNKAKIKKLNNGRNLNPDYGYNNIVLQNSTYNQTTYNYYTNDNDANKPSSRINTIYSGNKKKNDSTERINKSVKIATNRNKNKTKTKSSARH